MKNIRKRRNSCHAWKASGRHPAISLALLAATLAGPFGCSSPPVAQNQKPEVLHDVALAVAQKTTIPDWLEAVGTVQTAQKSVVASRAMGNILEIRAHEGDRVVSGQVLAVLDDAQPRAALEQATAAVNAAEKQIAAADTDCALAETTLQRYQQLLAKKSVSPQEFDEVKARYDSAIARRDMGRAGQAGAKAALAQAQTALGYTQLHAPFDGVVTEKKADVGTLATPGMAIFTIEDAGHYRLEAAVDEGAMGSVRMGESVTVIIDSLGARELPGKVTEIVPAADSTSRNFTVKIRLPANTQLRSGLFGRARFSRGQRATLVLPRSAAIQRGQLQVVYVVDPAGMVALRYVTLGAPAADGIEVLSGLQAGEKVIAAPGDRDLGGKQIAMTP